MKGVIQWLIDPKGGTPLVAVLAGLLGSVLGRLSGADQAAVDGCVQVVGGLVGKLFGL